MSSREAAERALFALSFPLTAVTSLLFIMLAARRLDPLAFAEFSASISIISVGALVFAPLLLATTQEVSRAAASPWRTQIADITRSSVARTGRVACAAAVAGGLLILPLSHALKFESPWPLAAATAQICLAALLGTYRSSARGSGNHFMYASGLISEALLRLGAGFVLLEVSPTPATALLAYSVATTMVLAVTASRTPRGEGASGTTARRHDYGRAIAPSAALLAVLAFSQHGDMLLVKRLFDSSGAANYAALVAASRAMVVVLMPLDAIFVPQLLRLAAGIQSAKRNLILALLFCGAGSAVVLAAFSLAPRAVLEAIVGHDLAGASDLLPYTGAAALIVFSSYIVGQGLVAMNGSRYVAFFAVAAIAQLSFIAFFHQTLREVVLAILISQATGLLCMAVVLSKRVRAIATERRGDD